MKNQLNAITILSVFGLLGLLLIGVLPNNASATMLDTRGPIRPTPQPTEVAAAPRITGGWIVLQAPESIAMSGLWTRIEWQDGQTKQWHLVDGWQGEFDGNGRVTWYVASKNLGEQTFRWVVFDSEAQAKRLAMSEPFDMPSGQEQKVIVEVTFDD